jgi:membrane protein
LLLAKACGVGDIARTEINRHLDAYITQIETMHDDPSVVATMSETRRMEKRSSAKAIATQAREVSNHLFDRAAQFDASTLGWIGLAMLAWTVISTFGMVETSMNDIWKVKAMRPLWKRCVLYLLVTIVSRILTALALSMPVLGVVKSVLDAASGFIPYSKWFMDLLTAVLFSKVVSISVTFAFAALGLGFFYKFMPYCRVKAAWALVSGFVTALVFALWLRACIIAQVGVANSSALYGSFAFFPILLAWIYISWQIILFGSVLSCQLQSIFSSSEV